jgi:hypothetical protein
VIQAHRRGDGVTGLGAELRRVKVGLGGRAEDLGDGQPAAEYFGIGERGGWLATEGLLDKAGGVVVRRGSEGRAA